MPTDEELNTHYSNRYYETLGDNRGMTEKLDDPDKFYKLQYENRLRYAETRLRDDFPRTVLDIGAGYGDFLQFMKDAGRHTQGVEPSEHACGAINKQDSLNIKCAAVDKLLDFAHVSVVTLNNVLEHLNDPARVLKMVRKHLLLPDGIVLIVLPNDFNVLQDILMKTVLRNDPSKHYYWVQPLDHLNYWSNKTIRPFLKTRGFKVLNLTTDFPMEIFPLMGEDYISNPELGRGAHLKRVQFERHLQRSDTRGFKDLLYSSLSDLGMGREMYIVAAKE